MTIGSPIRGAGSRPVMGGSPSRLKSVGLLLGLLLIVPLIACGIVQVNGPEIRRQAFDNLDSIARLKAEGIENWLAERQIDLEFLAASEGFAGHAERLALTGNADSRAFVGRRLAAYSKSRYYHSAILLNSAGQVLSAIGENNDASAAVTQQLLQTAMKSGQIVHSDLYRDANTGHIHLDYVLPLRGPGGRAPVVAVLLHVPADNFLFPYIQTWPTPSDSAETLLVRRDGDDVLFLNELRHRHGAALSLRLSLDARISPAAVAIFSGKAQTLEGVDYRGVPVFAATRPIAGTPWHLVAKTDRDEVMAPLKKLIVWVSLLALAAVSAIAMVVWRLWRQERHSRQRELADQAVTIQQEGEAKYRRLHESLRDAYVMVDMAGDLIDFNSAYRDMLGYSYEELRGLTYIDLTPAKWHEFEARIVEEQVVPYGQSEVYEKEYIRQDGTVFPVELRIFLLRGKDGQPEAMWAIVRDITERKRNEEEMKIFFELIPELVCVASTGGHLLKINAMWQEVLGYTEAEILATPFLDFIHPDDREATKQEVARQVAGNATLHFINRYRCKDGSYRWLEWSAAPVVDGKLLFAAARDITARLKIEAELEQHRDHLEELVDARTRELTQANAELSRSEQKFRAIAENGPFAVVISDPAQNTLYQNPMFERMFGYAIEDIPTVEAWWLRAYPDEQVRHEVRQRWNDVVEKAIRNRAEIPPQERLVTCKDGSQRHIEFRMASTGEFNVVIGIDITERIAASRALKDAKDAAEAASRAKSAFLANMSHELRTPLNSIIGFSDVLHGEAGLSKDQKDILAIIHKSGDHLLGLINDVLEIAKIEAGGVTLESAPFDINRLILDVTDMLRLRAQEKGLQLQIDRSSGFPRYIVADEAKLRQILINLISNAIKATVQGGVLLRLGFKRNHAGHLLIEVADTGCGISPQDQARILEPFVQLGKEGAQQGTGLGLAIIRQFVELMGGSLALTSAVGQGSTFRVDIPVRLARPEEIPPAASQARGEVTGLAPGQPACRVLVAEDQFENRLLLLRLLEHAGFEVRLAENGAEAVEQFQTWHPHFVWMDKRMPVMDGVEAARHIRALAGGEAVKIAAVTAFTFREEDEELMAAGFDAIVHKPYRPEQIFECMEHLSGLRFERAQAAEAPPHLPALSRGAMAALPEPLREELAQALVILDRERLLEIIERVTQTDPELGAALAGRVRHYDFAPILALLQGLPAANPGEDRA